MRHSKGFRRSALRYCIKNKLVAGGKGVGSRQLMALIRGHANVVTKDEVYGVLRIAPVLPRARMPHMSGAVFTHARVGPLADPAHQPKRVPDEEFFTSREWQELRYLALKEHGAKCQCCGAGRRDGVRIHVDHVKPRSKFPELQWDLANLQVLCEDCNLGKGAWDQTDWRGAAE